MKKFGQGTRLDFEKSLCVVFEHCFMSFSWRKVSLLSFQYLLAFSRNHHSNFIKKELMIKLPKSFTAEFGKALATSLSNELSAIVVDIDSELSSKDEIFANVRPIYQMNANLLLQLRDGNMDSVESLIADSKASLSKLLEAFGGDPVQREEKLSFPMERLCVGILLYNFYTKGLLLTKSELQICSDDEYIGAVLSFAQELSRYSLGRACEGDVDSISVCLRLVRELNGKMLEFDFRNGPLRRKYDGLKYAVKAIEDIYFELSLQDAFRKEEEAADSGEPDLKRPRGIDSAEGCVDTSPSLFDAAEFDAIRARMEAFDKCRESVIKDSRDVQKFSKLGIYAVIRGSLEDAKRKLCDAADMANKIFLIVNQHKTLRAGAFSNSLEEWAEGVLVLEWVRSKRVLKKSEMLSYSIDGRSCALSVNNDEYIGGLSDFTGEIGRMALALASKRDIEGVREIHQADIVIANFITRANISNRYGKKLEAVNTNLRKVEDIVFELSMLCRGSRAGKKIIDSTNALSMSDGLEEKEG